MLELNEWFKVSVGVLIVVGFLITLAAMFFIPIPVANKMAVDIVLGTLGTMTVSIVQFLFGSSQGSKEKNKLLASAIANNSNNPDNS